MTSVDKHKISMTDVPVNRRRGGDLRVDGGAVDGAEAELLGEKVGGGLGEQVQPHGAEIAGALHRGVGEHPAEAAAAAIGHDGEGAQDRGLVVGLDRDDSGDALVVAHDEDLAGALVGEVLGGQARLVEDLAHPAHVGGHRGHDRIAQALAHLTGGEPPELEPLDDRLEAEAQAVSAARARSRGGRF